MPLRLHIMGDSNDNRDNEYPPTGGKQIKKRIPTGGKQIKKRMNDSNDNRDNVQKDSDSSGLSDENDSDGSSSVSSVEQDRAVEKDGNGLSTVQSLRKPRDRKESVEFYARRYPYKKTWSHCICNGFDGHAEDETTQKVFLSVKLVFNETFSNDELSDGSRFYKTTSKMASKCTT